MVNPRAVAIGATSASSVLSLQQQQQQSQAAHQWRPSSLFLRSLAIGARTNPNFFRNPCNLVCPRAQGDDSYTSNSSAAGASSDSVVGQVAVLDEEPDTPGVAAKAAPRKPSMLERGGTLKGEKAAGKDPSASALGKSAPRLAMTGPFEDARWKNGTWDIQQFTVDGKVDWDAVIDAEVIRRKWLEDNPEASTNEDPVVFDTGIIPWWAWVKRFHLPEAELLNGRAAMVGFFMGYVVDSLTGVGLVDQTSSFLGKLLLFISVLGVLFIRKNEDLDTLKQLAQEWTFYDRQWQATWQEDQAPGSKREE
ncbi:hypothetical protein GOP47_0027458 [Adiantum capillus-veneris]|nr:hypothetical protein GOP47_0027458 [Adiantum capillus-veneris]